MRSDGVEKRNDHDSAKMVEQVGHKAKSHTQLLHTARL